MIIDRHDLEYPVLSRMLLAVCFIASGVVLIAFLYGCLVDDARGQPVPVVPAPSMPTSAGAPTDAGGLAVSVLTDLERGDWRHLLAVVLVAVAIVGRKVARLAPGKLGKFLATDLGGLVVVVTISEAAALAAVLFGPTRLNGHVLLNALFVGLSGVGVHQAAIKAWAHFTAGKPGDADQVPNKPDPPIEGPVAA